MAGQETTAQRLGRTDCGEATMKTVDQQRSEPALRESVHDETRPAAVGNGTTSTGPPMPDRSPFAAQRQSRTDRLIALWKTPLVLLGLSVLSYGVLIPWLGFYWDDWPAMWVLHSLGADALKEYMATDRPFLGWLYAVTGSLFGVHPLPWHLFALFTRWMSSVALWWLLRGLWPEQPQACAAAACLYAVYPGFTLQPIAWTHSHVFLQLGLVFVSLGAMVWAARRSRWFWPLSAAALGSAAVTMAISEYFVGLELLRPAVLWVVFSASGAALPRLIRTVRSYVPYLAVLVSYLGWRLVLFHPVGVNDQTQVFQVIRSNPIGYVLHRLYVVFTDLIEAGALAWTRTATSDLFAFAGIRWVLGGLLLGTVAAAVTFRHVIRLEPASSDAQESPAWSAQAIGLGMAAMILGGLPFWFGNRDIQLDTLSDRYTLPVVLGVTLLVTAASHRMMRRGVQRAALIALIVGLSVAFHLRSTAQFAQDWSAQTSLMWQLHWRAPALKPSTLVLADESVVAFPRSYSLLGPINFQYAPGHRSSSLAYGFFALPTVLGDELGSLIDGEPFSYAFRILSFQASTSESLVVWFSPPSCLRVLDSTRDEIPHLPTVARAARSLSHVNRILARPSGPSGPSAPATSMFGAEPDHGWCYYFEKADLARQQGDWQQVAYLGDEVKRLALRPSDATEWLPILEGYIRTGRRADALDVMTQVVREIPAFRSTISVHDPNRVNKVPISQSVPSGSPALCRLLEDLDPVPAVRSKIGCVLS